MPIKEASNCEITGITSLNIVIGRVSKRPIERAVQVSLAISPQKWSLKGTIAAGAMCVDSLL